MSEDPGHTHMPLSAVAREANAQDTAPTVSNDLVHPALDASDAVGADEHPIPEEEEEAEEGRRQPGRGAVLRLDPKVSTLIPARPTPAGKTDESGHVKGGPTVDLQLETDSRTQAVPKGQVIKMRDADGYAHACQAVFAGYIAVAQRRNLAPTIAGFWATPQRHMVLPSLEILARLILPPIPSPSSNIPDIPEAKDESVSLGSGERTRTISPMAKRDTDTRQTGETVQQGPDAGLAGRVGELTISTTASTPEGNMGSQVPERHPYGEEMRALRVVLGRKDNRYTRPIHPPTRTHPVILEHHAIASGSKATKTKSIVIPLSESTRPLSIPTSTVSATASDPVDPSTGSDLGGGTGTDVRWKLTSMGRDLFRPIATSPLPLPLVTATLSPSSAMSMDGHAGGVGTGQVRTPSWWHM